ncbi:MAG: hypothetical protein M1617_07200 [Actinobacteria bacterium]|nr:hypothetical protein [Actinomycetota bacterium]MCL5888055.1 hypothetical protein [Actinomycetota bacterium]
MKRSMLTKVLSVALTIVLLAPAAAFASTCDCDAPKDPAAAAEKRERERAKDAAEREFEEKQDAAEREFEEAQEARERGRGSDAGVSERDFDRAQDAAEREFEAAQEAREREFERVQEAREKSDDAKKYRDRNKDKAKGRPDWAGKDKDDDYDHVIVPPVVGLPDDGSVGTTPSVDATPVVDPEKLTGLANALSRIQRNIERAEAKVAAGQKEQVPPGLLRVLEKFLAWLGLAPVDPAPPADPVDPTPDPSEEPTPPVTPPAPVPVASTVSAILAAPVVGQSVILTGEIVSMPAYDDLMLSDGTGTIFIDGDSDFGTFAVGDRVQVTGWVYFEDLLGRWEIQATGVQLQ